MEMISTQQITEKITELQRNLEALNQTLQQKEQEFNAEVQKRQQEFNQLLELRVLFIGELRGLEELIKPAASEEKPEENPANVAPFKRRKSVKK